MYLQIWNSLYYLEQLELVTARCGLTELVKFRRALHVGCDLRLPPVLMQKVSSNLIQRRENGSIGCLSGSRVAGRRHRGGWCGWLIDEEACTVMHHVDVSVSPHS
eukprot:3426481-Prymnesium_polylepis.1